LRRRAFILLPQLHRRWRYDDVTATHAVILAATGRPFVGWRVFTVDIFAPDDAGSPRMPARAHAHHVRAYARSFQFTR